MTRQPLWVILCRLSEKGREEIEEEMKGKKENRHESDKTEIKTFPSTLTCYKDSRPFPTVSQYQLDASVT